MVDAQLTTTTTGFTSTTLLLLLLFATPTQGQGGSPNVVIILADDMGWSDVGFRDREMVTPNIDTLYRDGVHLNFSYMQQVCTPSRAAFFSGYYPFRMGLQNSVLTALSNDSMPLNYRLMSQHMQDLDYSTHYVGKWHLGFCRKEMTPTARGFDSFYGMYTGKSDYYTHISKWKGYDFHDDKGDDLEVAWDAKGKYSTTLFTNRALEIIEKHDQSKPLFLVLSYQAVHGPLQVPSKYLSYCANVTTGGVDRTTHCAMTAAMDEGIGEVMAKLKDKGLYDNLITLFMSDNGGPIKHQSSNWPLRGSKITLWEGGTRVVTILHSEKHLPAAPYNWNGLMHAVDWFPTLVSAAGGDTSGLAGMDGKDNWQRIVDGSNSRRTGFVYNIDDIKNISAIREGSYKLIHNKGGKPDGWYNPPAGETNNRKPPKQYPEWLLFNIDEDPIEETDLSSNSSFTGILQSLQNKLEQFKPQVIPSTEKNKPKAGRPKKHNGTWVSGWC